MDEPHAVIWLLEDRETGQRRRYAAMDYVSAEAAAMDIHDWFTLDDEDRRAISATVIREADLQPWMYDDRTPAIASESRP